MDVVGSLNNALQDVITFLPKFILFLVILLIGWLIAKALRKVVDVVLERVGFDRAVERGGIRRALERSRYDASGLIAALVYYAVLLITLQFAFGVFGPNPVSDLLAAIVGWLPRAIIAIVIVVVAAAIASALYDIVGSALSGYSFGPFLARALQVFIIALGVIAALNQVGIATAVTTPVLIAVLAIIVGVIVVGVGGGLVRPMQQRWTDWLDRAEDTLSTERAKHEAYLRGREDAARHLSPTGDRDWPSAGTPGSGTAGQTEHEWSRGDRPPGSMPSEPTQGPTYPRSHE